MKQYILFFVIVFVSCEQKIKVDSSRSIGIEYNLSKEIKLSNYVSKIHPIQLETTDTCIIGNITKVQLYGEKIFFLDEMTSVLYEYDISGKFCKSLNKRGVGPGEYILLKDFAVEKEGIYVLDFSMQSILFYDFDFNYKATYKYDTFASNFVCLANSFFLYNEINLSENDFQFTQITQKGDILGEYLKRESQIPLFNWANSNVFSKERNQLYFSPRYSNDIYCKTDSSLHKIFHLDFGHKSMPEQESHLDHNIYDMGFPYILREKFYVSDRFLIVDFFYRNKRMFTFFDQEQESAQTGFVKNDMIPEFDRFFPQWISNGCLIETVNVSEIIETFPIAEMGIDIERLSIDENPIILLYYLKK